MALGSFYLEAGNLEEAARELKRALGEAPQNLLARRLLADLYEKKGEKAAALEALEQLARLSPLDRELEERMAGLRGGEGAGPEGAIERATGEEALPTESLAQLYESQGLFAEALEVYEKLLEKDPEKKELKEKVRLLGEWASGDKGAVEEAGKEVQAPPPAEEPAEAAPGEGSEVEALTDEAEAPPAEEKAPPEGAVAAPAPEEEEPEPRREPEPEGEAASQGADVEKVEEEEPIEAVSQESPPSPEEQAPPDEARIEAILEESSLEEALAEYRAALAQDPSDQSLRQKVREISEKLGVEVPELEASPSGGQEAGAGPEESAGEGASPEKAEGHEAAARNLEKWLENVKRDAKGGQEKD